MMHSHYNRKNRNKTFGDVLILVVMDDALARRRCAAMPCDIRVLILVVMDDALALKRQGVTTPRP